jgi:hypothetical protein
VEQPNQHPQSARHALPFEQLVTRIKSEYIEMPGLWLTPEQGARLWAIERNQCEQLLRTLVEQRFLTVSDGRYGRSGDDTTSVRHAVKAPISA